MFHAGVTKGRRMAMQISALTAYGESDFSGTFLAVVLCRREPAGQSTVRSLGSFAELSTWVPPGHAAFRKNFAATG